MKIRCQVLIDGENFLCPLNLVCASHHEVIEALFEVQSEVARPLSVEFFICGVREEFDDMPESYSPEIPLGLSLAKGIGKNRLAVDEFAAVAERCCCELKDGFAFEVRFESVPCRSLDRKSVV